MTGLGGGAFAILTLLAAPAATTPGPLSLPPAILRAAVAETGETGAQRDGFALTGPIRQGGLVQGVAPAGTRALALDGQPVAMAADRHFLIGFDRDAGPAADLAATLNDGRVILRALTVTPRTWSIQSLPTLPKATPKTPADIARRTAEVARIQAARARTVASDGWRQAPLWPAIGRISGVFGSQRIYAGEPGAYHAGVDIARPTGTPIVAPLDGVVVLAAATDPFSLEGHLLMIDHGFGLVSAFLHLSRIDVASGDRVTRGQPVGAIGMTGRATGPHLHWAMTWAGRRIDPQPLAGAMVNP
ncbi:MAG TPA: M23 family metallopeptidase [Sphingomonas sp.]|uniref:M23 family metallopeptidase n=1 Tax=Sphingomonas sp. TaxID=28214 RepID=UPI002ED9056F